MSTKIFLGIMVVVLAIAGYVAYTKVSDDEYVPLGGEGISFICEDSTYFVAEFSPNFDQVNIMVDGIVERSLNRARGTDLYIFEDDSYTYTFAGETVRVENRLRGTTTVCSQPFDPNNAPYNFGDLGENNEEEVVETTADGLEGKWRSTEDENFTREFRAGGVAVDGYTDMEDDIGTWEVFVGNTGVDTPFPQEDGGTYLKMMMGEEFYFFKVGEVTATELELVYLDRGGVLSFTRVE